MARTKKSNKKNDETPKIIRNYDPMSLEKRLYDLDHAPQRSWDLYAMEKRIYDLEQGGSPTPPTPVESLVKFGRENGDVLSGSYTFETDKTMNIWLDLEASKLSNYSFKKNGESFDISSYQKSTLNVSNYGGYTYYEDIPFTSGDVFSWTVTDNYRCFVAFG